MEKIPGEEFDYKSYELLLKVSNEVSGLKASFDAFMEKTKDDFIKATRDDAAIHNLIDEKSKMICDKQKDLEARVVKLENNKDIVASQIREEVRDDIKELSESIRALNARPKDVVFKAVMSGLGVLGLAILTWLIALVAQTLKVPPLPA